MPKITYPRPCPTCGKPLSKTQFYRHKQLCSGQRYFCTQCSLSFADKRGLQNHEEQQHSPNPPRFYCPKCNQGFTTKRNRNLHLQTVRHDHEVLVKPCFPCVQCDASFTRKSNLQAHERYVHGRIRRAYEMNLRLHLQKVGFNDDGERQWRFVESRRIRPGEARVCPCGQTGISNKYFFEHVETTKETFVGSTCIHHVDKDFGRVIGYFERLLAYSTRGIYRGVDEAGLHKFQVQSNTTLVLGALNVVHTYNPPVERNQDGTWQVKVNPPIGTLLRPGHPYRLWLKAKYEQGHLVFTIVRCRESIVHE